MTQMNALALIDGDNFGIINEKYGHAAGNIVIYHIAKMIENCIRCSDVLIRYEGDKFLLLMENKKLLMSIRFQHLQIFMEILNYRQM